MTCCAVLPLYFLLQSALIHISHPLLCYNLFNHAPCSTILPLVFCSRPSAVWAALFQAPFPSQNCTPSPPSTCLTQVLEAISAGPVPPETLFPFSGHRMANFLMPYVPTLQDSISCCLSLLTYWFLVHKSSSPRLLQIDLEQKEDVWEIIFWERVIFSIHYTIAPVLKSIDQVFFHFIFRKTKVNNTI